MDIRSPQVSYVMAAFNHADHVASMIDSICAQTHTDWELIVIDDGSTDATAKILGECAKKEPRIRVEIQQNQGIVATRNRGATLATGEFLSFVDSDDFLLPNRTEKLLVPLVQNPKVVLSYGDAWIQNKAGERTSFWSKYPVISGDGPNPLLEGGCFIPALSVLTRRSALVESGPLWGGGGSTDYLKWLDLSLLGKLERVPGEPLAVWRHHGDNLSQSQGEKRIAQYLELAQALANFNERAINRGITVQQRSLHKRRAHLFLKAGLFAIAMSDFRSARGYLKQSCDENPNGKSVLAWICTTYPLSVLCRPIISKLLAST